MDDTTRWLQATTVDGRRVRVEAHAPLWALCGVAARAGDPTCPCGCAAPDAPTVHPDAREAGQVYAVDVDSLAEGDAPAADPDDVGAVCVTFDAPSS